VIPTLTVNDVTHLNPIPVWAIATPTGIAEVQAALADTSVPLSVGGGHFSMGGQTASPGSLHLDMRRMNQVLRFSPQEQTIRVQAGIRWCDIQKFVDPHGLAVRIMQTYANFTVGGALSVNCHGRYIGLGPVVLSVLSIRVVLIGGEIIDATPADNAEIFYGCIGGYGALGVIVEVELRLTQNCRMERSCATMPLETYARYFKEKVRNTPGVIFHNADIYAPHFNRVRAVSWTATNKPATTTLRLQWQRRTHWVEKYFIWAVTETPYGKWRREHLIDPLLYLSRPVHWRNYEAGYDVAELEPVSRTHRSYVLQEYFVPVAQFESCARAIAAVLKRHRVNALNISVRHALADPGTLMSWTRGETFAFVLYYKQRTRANARDRVGVWTRELIETVLAHGGSYYLPYQLHATADQFHRAYPGARRLFELKRRLDPDYRLRNALWDKYYAPEIGVTVQYPDRIGAAAGMPLRLGSDQKPSDFRAVMGDSRWHDAMYGFLHNIFRLYPEDRFHALIKQACGEHDNDEAVYRHVQQQLPSIKPTLGDIRLAIPALKKQKNEMLRQTLELLGKVDRIDGYVEIGTTGRYVSVLRKHVQVTGPIFLVNDVAPSNSPQEWLERGGLKKIGNFVPLDSYSPLPAAAIADASVDLVSCYVGLHHMTPQTLDPFIRSIARVLRPGGRFVLRDHDVQTPEMFRFVGLIHSVFNAGTGASWEQNRDELRYFVSLDVWVERLAAIGLIHEGPRLFQANDPSDNALLVFRREAAAA
jgi:FAD/FMN-containing dehydrogenase/SAM-dependent methyltransferase